MILDRHIKMSWNSNNKKYYTNNGYIFTKMYDLFDVDINDLNPGSSMKVNVKCDVCGKEKKLSYTFYIDSVKNGGYYACSQKCSNNKAKQTCLKNLGTEYAFQCEMVKNKSKQTCLEKYNVENVAQSEIIKEKIKQTCNRLYNKDNPFQVEKFIQKGLNTRFINAKSKPCNKDSKKANKLFSLLL